MPEPKPGRLNAVRSVRTWTLRLTPLALLMVVVLVPIEPAVAQALVAGIATISVGIIVLTSAVVKMATAASAMTATIRTAVTTRGAGYFLLGAVVVGLIWVGVSLLRSRASAPRA